MHNFVKYFYDNKMTILKITGIIVLIFIIIQILNAYYKNQQKKISEEVQNNIDSGKTTIDNSDYLINKKSSVSQNNDKKIENIMKEFVEYCNSEDFSSAYEMLTEECKNKIYTTEEEFVEKYAKKIFSEYKTYSIQAWDAQEGRITYLVNYKADALATGKLSNAIEDYYTFVEQTDGDYKININSFIYSESYTDLVTKENNIEAKILSSDVYKDYVIYEFQIKNNTENRILLNGDKYVKRIFLKDKEGVTYSSIQSDFDKDKEIILNPGNIRKFRVRFNKVYNTNVRINKIVLNDIVLNYDEYLENTEDYENRTKMEIAV